MALSEVWPQAGIILFSTLGQWPAGNVTIMSHLSDKLDILWIYAKTAPFSVSPLSLIVPNLLLFPDILIWTQCPEENR